MHSRLLWADRRLRHRERVMQEVLMVMVMVMEGTLEGGLHVGSVHGPRERPIRRRPSFNVVYFCYLCVHAHMCTHATSHM